MFKELPETLFYCTLIDIFMSTECVALCTYASFRPYNSYSGMRHVLKLWEKSFVLYRNTMASKTACSAYVP